jgi:hypothetical protein
MQHVQGKRQRIIAVIAFLFNMVVFYALRQYNAFLVAKHPYLPFLIMLPLLGIQFFLAYRVMPREARLPMFTMLLTLLSVTLITFIGE